MRPMITSAVGTRPARGISLIEVLIALVVLSTGILALTLLQLTITRSAAEAKAQSFAVGYAQQALEQVRAQSLSLASYNSLADQASPVAVPGSTEATGNAYTIQRTVTRYVQSSDAALCNPSAVPCFIQDVVDVGTGSLDEPEFKAVTMVVQWTAADNSTKTIRMTDNISKLGLAGDRDLLKFRGGTKGGPKVLISMADSGMDAPGVIPIATGGADGEATAASNPKPLIDNSTGTAAVSFNVLTYLNGGTGTIEVQRQVETRVLSCKCQYGAFPIGTSGFKTTKMRPTYWTGSNYIVPETVQAAAVTTPNARRALSESYQGQNNQGQPATITRTINQSDLCDECCRDHHDPNTLAGKAKFDPHLPSGVSHEHYRYPLDTQGNTTLAPELVAPSSGNQFVEACRVVRVGGIWRTAADLNMEHMSLLRTNQVTAGDGSPAWAPTSTASSRYVSFVTDFLKERILQAGVPYTVGGNALTTEEKLALEEAPTPSLNAPEVIALAPSTADTKYLHNRGLYLDYLEPSAKTHLNQLLKACEEPSGSEINCVLPFLPFVTVNATELANWERAGKIQITNNALDGSDFAVPTRGVTQPTGLPVAGEEAWGYSNMFHSNSGLAFALPIDPSDGMDLVNYPMGRLRDEQRFEFAEGGILDSDSDGVADELDNCPGVWNPGQLDSDGNGVGDACDAESDTDGDGIKDPVDNCPYVSNSDQLDTNGDGRGDACPVPVLPYTVELTAFGAQFSLNPSMRWDPSPPNGLPGQDCSVTSGASTPKTYSCADTSSESQTLKVSRYNQIVVTSANNDQVNNPCRQGSGQSAVGPQKVNQVMCVVYTAGNLIVDPVRNPSSFAATKSTGPAFVGIGFERDISNSFPNNAQSVTYALDDVTAGDVYRGTFESRTINLTTAGSYTCDVAEGLPKYDFSNCGE